MARSLRRLRQSPTKILLLFGFRNMEQLGRRLGPFPLLCPASLLRECDAA